MALESAENRRLLTELVRFPAGEIRKEAVLKRAELVAEVGRRDPATLDKSIPVEVAAVSRLIRWGDELRSIDSETDRQDRRRLYAKAYIRAREAQAAVAGLR